MRFSRSRCVFALLIVSLAMFAPACASEGEGIEGNDNGDGIEENLTSSAGMSAAAVKATSIDGFTLDTPTPLGKTVFQASRLWMTEQDPRYALAKNCANNVSIVLRSALRADGLIGPTAHMSYEAESVWGVVEAVRRSSGSHVVDMPLLARDGKFVATLNSEFKGSVPVGTIVAGCPKTFPRCNGQAGAQHVAVIGHTDNSGIVWVYHNNWLRPDNLGGQRPARLAPYMVSKANLASGHPRQWMPTPWVRLTKSADGTVTKAESMLPEIDDMDPAQYFMKLAVIPEIHKLAH